jgi:hypothetical protein
MDAGWDISMSFCSAKTHSHETAWMPFHGSARDRSGIFAEQKLERIARWAQARRDCAHAPKKTKNSKLIGKG